MTDKLYFIFSFCSSYVSELTVLKGTTLHCPLEKTFKGPLNSQGSEGQEVSSKNTELVLFPLLRAGCWQQATVTVFHWLPQLKSYSWTTIPHWSTKSFFPTSYNFWACPISSCVGTGQVQNGILYIRYRSSSKLTTAKWCKTLAHENLSHSIEKYTPRVPLTPLTVKKIEHKNSNFALLLLFPHTLLKNYRAYTKVLHIKLLLYY